MPINIDFAFPGYAVYAVIGISVIVALFFRMFLNRQRQVIKPVRDYHCVSAQMAWGGGNNTVDDTIDSAPADSLSRGQEVRKSEFLEVPWIVCKIPSRIERGVTVDSRTDTTGTKEKGDTPSLSGDNEKS